ncbi:MAG: bifunctional phosphoserine phosphatase/homoserine phosphotransferase ThrH [Verrucomicrobiota bacterium]|nr:bifunctional phosphoserine phosphatase/homoserine phosphotransferase ThrH [Verrucomicrobiota bacterium]
MQSVVTLDLEGVLVPEIWIAFAEKTGIDTLRKTTRDEPDYDVLMKYRLAILRENNLKLSDIQGVIGTLSPMEGAKGFLDELRAKTQVVILSDTFLQFAEPLMRQLDWPTLFCHHLEVNDDVITNYCLRQPDQKRRSVEAFKSLNFQVIAAGDSYNDTTMLGAADQGILFRAPDNVKAEFGNFPAVEEYSELMALIEEHL